MEYSDGQLSGKKTLAASQNIKERDYWLRKLAGEWVKKGFPVDFSGGMNTSRRENRKESVIFRFSQELSAKLIKLSNGSDHRLFIILVSGVVLLLYKYTGCKDTIVGAPIYKQKIAGDFINTVLPIRTRFDSRQSFKEILIAVRQTVIEAEENQNYPIEALVNKLDLQPLDNEFPLFDTAILLKNIQDKSYLQHIPTRLLLSFCREDSDSGLEADWEYNPNYYQKETLTRIFTHLSQLFHFALADVNSEIRAIDILSPDEKQKLLREFNDTAGESPTDQTLHRWFEARVDCSPDTIALTGVDRVTPGPVLLTYKELNSRANRVARVLRTKGAAPGIIVALLVNRSVEMITGLLAVLKAGGALLPIDPAYPDERKKFMLADSGIRLVLTDHDKDRLDYLAARVEAIDLQAESIRAGKGTNLKYINKPADLFYLIYTSGSTGKPKGVMLEHRHMVNLIYFDLHHTNIDCSSILQFHTIGFDASFHEIFCALLSGGRLLLIKEETRFDIPQLLRVVEKNDTKTLFLPMAFLKLIFGEADYLNMFPGCVRHIQTAGEQVVVSPLFRKFLQQNKVYLHNHYGPSETHVVTALTLKPEAEIPELPTIGKPILNTTAYILDREMKLLPVGVPGELGIGGMQVGRGYLDKPLLTAEKFVKAPATSFKPQAQAKNVFPTNQLPTHQLIYLSGDLARWQPDGNIEFLGRIDDQIKIRGFRVEPGEVESLLFNHDRVKEAVVIVDKNKSGEKHLCAYITAREEVTADELRAYLSHTLPDYMIPSYFVPLAEIPLTPTGKIDKRALPPIDDPGLETTRVMPRSETEVKLSRLWQEVLDTETDKIGIDDNFFKLGGHSLKATILISKIHKTFNVKVTLAEIFNSPTIRGLAAAIKELTENIYLSIEPAESRQFYPLSSAQKRLYIQQQIIPDNISYNNPMIIILEGALDLIKLEKVFCQLIHRHEVFRTTFEMYDEEPVQRIHKVEDIDFKIEYYEANSRQEEAAAGCRKLVSGMIERFIRPFDFTLAPLLRVGLIKLPAAAAALAAPGDSRLLKKGICHILMIDMHHIITDGNSLGILGREFMQLYGGETLPESAIQYKDFSQWQNRLFTSAEIKKQEDYWLKQFAGNVPVLDLPTDYPRGESRSFAGEHISFEINRDLTAAIKQLVLETEATLHVVLLTITNILLAKYSGQEDIVVGTGIAGKQHADLQNVIGLFINMLAMRNKPTKDKAFIRFLNEVKDNALNAYANQDYQFEELVQRLGLQGNPARNPLFDIAFQTQNIDLPEIKIEGLTFRPYDHGAGVSHFDLVIYIYEQEESIGMRFLYSPALFKEETIKTMTEHFVEITGQVLSNNEILLQDIEIFTDVLTAGTKVSRDELQFQF